MSKFNILTLLSALLMANELCASVVERVNINMPELSLRSSASASTPPLVVQSVMLPALCAEEPCRNTAKLVWFDGSEIQFKGTEGFYRNVLPGLDVGVKISAETTRTLPQGKGGYIEVTLYQGSAPYHSGAFSKPMLRYQNTGAENNEVVVDVAGVVKSGSCLIAEGENLRFSVQTDLNEMARLRNSKKLVQSKNITFDCVNVNAVDIKFNSANLSKTDTKMLFDESTGAGISFNYQANGTTGDILWDGTAIKLPVNNDRLSMMLNLFLHGGNEKVKAGPFSFSGVYSAEYH